MTLFSFTRVLHIHHRRSGHVQTIGMSVCNRFVALAWIAQLHGDFVPPALDSRHAIYSLSKLSPGSVAFPRRHWLAVVSGTKEPLQAGTPKRAAGIWHFSCLFSVPTCLFLCYWPWISSSVSNRHDHCHHYHCQYTIIAGSQASGFNLYMCSCHACLFFLCVFTCSCWH
ncbi:hypothetical protein BDV10DRAFT_84982 [Aspergillus recurvatus]